MWTQWGFRGVWKRTNKRRTESRKWGKGGEERGRRKEESKINQIKVEIKSGVHLCCGAGTKLHPLTLNIFLHSSTGDILSIAISQKDARLSNYCHSKSLKLQHLIYGFRIPTLSYLFLV